MDNTPSVYNTATEQTVRITVEPYIAESIQKKVLEEATQRVDAVEKAMNDYLSDPSLRNRYHVPCEINGFIDLKVKEDRDTIIKEDLVYLQNLRRYPDTTQEDVDLIIKCLSRNFLKTKEERKAYWENLMKDISPEKRTSIEERVLYIRNYELSGCIENTLSKYLLHYLHRDDTRAKNIVKDILKWDIWKRHIYGPTDEEIARDSEKYYRQIFMPSFLSEKGTYLSPLFKKLPVKVQAECIDYHYYEWHDDYKYPIYHLLSSLTDDEQRILKDASAEIYAEGMDSDTRENY